jgi:UDP-glucose 4-epimerase
MSTKSKHILVTGGAGYIGSHTCIELLNQNYSITVIDNLSNSKYAAIERIKKITNKPISFEKIDIRDFDNLNQLISSSKFDLVIHFAGLKAVGESVEKPLTYYENNVIGTITLLKAMQQNKLKNIIFSSSATVYGNPQYIPVDENHPLMAVNPYGTTKLTIENILKDLYNSDPEWNIVILRYFNPVGAHESGLIGEDPQGIPNNLMPYISQVAVGRLPILKIFGNDYPTNDGTGIRDYIHVVDLAVGHVAACNYLNEERGCFIFNLGTGRGYSVLEMVAAFEKASGRKIPYQIVERRPGDVPIIYANVEKAAINLGWRAQRDIDAMCRDTWRWQSQNPHGLS